jgi:hypothetical protein
LLAGVPEDILYSNCSSTAPQMYHEEMPHVSHHHGPRIGPVGCVQAVLVPRIILAKVRARMPARMYVNIRIHRILVS